MSPNSFPTVPALAQALPPTFHTTAGFFPTHTSHPAHPDSFKLLNVAHKVLAWAASDSWILHGAHGGTSSKPSPGESQLATPLCACTPSEKNMNREEHTIMGTQHFYIQ